MAVLKLLVGHIGLIVFIFLSLSFEIQGKKTPCPPLPLTPDVVISCRRPKDNNQKVPCTGPISGAKKGTIAKYKCTSDQDFREMTIVCKCYGKWDGLDDFMNYTAACSTTQHHFTLDGPSELNSLTAPQIQKLDGNITSTSDSPISEFVLDALAYHNFYRSQHGASPLHLNDTLNHAAQDWADHEVNANDFGPEPWSANKTYISNLYMLTLGANDFDKVTAVKLAVGRWYENGANYDFDIPFANAFSAMMWNSTTDLGVGVAENNGNILVVCNYWPPGNVYLVGGGGDALGLFRQNVFPLLNSSTPATTLTTTQQ